MTFERFTELLDEEMKLLPDYVYEELSGGVLVDEAAKLHPKRLMDDLYILGTYSSGTIFGKQIVLYYGSFMKTMGSAPEERIRLQIRDTLRHEFLHHLETRAGLFGRGTLIEEDRDRMMRYYMMHRERAEAAAAKEADRESEAEEQLRTPGDKAGSE